MMLKRLVPALIPCALFAVTGCSPAPELESQSLDAPVTTYDFRETNVLGLITDHVAFNNKTGVDLFTLDSLDDTLIFVYRAQRDMNQHFARISIFTEGNIDGYKNKIIPEEAYAENSVDWIIGGHDLEAMNICRFFAHAQGNNIELRQQELKVSELLKKQFNVANWNNCESLANTQTVLVQFDTVAGGKFATYSHELLHAVFFNNRKMEQLISKYWLDLPAATQQTVRDALANSYDESDDRLMANEFYAYTLMVGQPNQNTLYAMTDLDLETERTNMMQAITDAGLADELVQMPQVPEHVLRPSDNPAERAANNNHYWLDEVTLTEPAFKTVDGTLQICFVSPRSDAFVKTGDFKMHVDEVDGQKELYFLFDRNNLLGDNGVPFAEFEVCFSAEEQGLTESSEFELMTRSAAN